MLTLHCTASNAIVTQKGDLKGYGMVWYYPKGIANILSLHKVQEKYRVTYDNSMMAGFQVHKKSDGTSHMFDVKHDTVHILVNTVDSIKDKYG